MKKSPKKPANAVAGFQTTFHTATRWIALFAATVVLAACASGHTPYMPAQNEDSFGYRESALGENRYRVTFAGNSFTSSDQVQDYTLLRAAELTIQKGYDWFSVANRDTATIEDSTGDVSTSVGYSTVPMVETRCGLLTCSSRYSTYPTLATRVDMPDRDRKSYTSQLEIVMQHGTAERDADSYDARELIDVIRARM